MERNKIEDVKRVELLFERISSLIEQARRVVVSTADIAEVKTRFEVGFEESISQTNRTVWK